MRILRCTLILSGGLAALSLTTPLSFGSVGGAVGLPDDVALIPFKSAPFAALNATSWQGIFSRTRRSYTGHVAVLEDSGRYY